MSADHLIPDVAAITDALADLLDLEPDDLTPGTELAAIDGWDSVNALRVLLYLERDLGRRLDYERFTAATTVADLAALAAPVATRERQAR
ncbi:acyl carrier protein [Micromonospora sp. NBC_01813]|uniref:acyl carrier protein n=1 Tax=Micromonospora sp. NBC_01813 TaxID=2975988 RepID=UPI002DD823B0|nr:acyl carrier protein [Micromonospora sp. NBC_01813]WSA08959.1 acyl carrier protein [Micromonospora sp. NBC_01813]